MRDIEFRAKDYKGKWVYGNLLVIEDECFIITVSRSDWKKIKLEKIEINHDTVGQYTGLKDKNGTKIFEGDIVKNSNGQLYTIRYICGGFDCEPIKEFYKAFKITWNTLGEIQNASWCESNCEVIGNIYDNPELLKENEDEL